MLARDPAEDERASTPLELFFDLVFVVAVASASERLHHGLSEGAGASDIVSFVTVFIAIWWAWMNFTWFASAYDSDDVVYRISVFVMMSGALILAAGVPRAFDERNFDIATLGYVVMRLALVTQWIRASRADAPRRTTTRRYAIGVSACQVGWIAALALPVEASLLAFTVLIAAEVSVPIWAEAASPTAWHPVHIAERYGLFTIIVLGESILASSFAIRTAVDEAGLTGELVLVLAGGLLIVFSMWWLYFDRPGDPLLSTTRGAFLWGYGHLFVFGSAAAVGAGLSVAIEHASHHGELSDVGAGASVAIPVAIYVVSLWIMHLGSPASMVSRASGPITAVLVLLSPFTPEPVLVTGVLVTGIVAVKVVLGMRDPIVSR